MRFLFIYPDIGGIFPNFSPAIEVLSACLKEAGNEVEVIHVNDKFTPPKQELILEKVLEFSPDIIGITAVTNLFKFCDETAGYLKSHGFDKMIICGGIHPTIAPNDLEKSNFDAFSIGEGELSLVELCRRMENGEDIYSVKGMIYKKDGEIIDNGYPDVVTDLDTLPPRDFEVMEIGKLLDYKNHFFSTGVSRGCPFPCSFCINSKLKKIYNGSCNHNYYRVNSVDRAISDLLLVIEKYHEKIDVIDFEDDLLLMNKKWILEFCEKYKKLIYEPYGIKFVMNSRADTIDEERVLKLQEAGCEFIAIGIETGDENLRNNILKKHIYDKDLIYSFDLLNRLGMRSHSFFMIGIPGENEESIQCSMRLLRRLKPGSIRMTIFQPFIGTELYDLCEKEGMLTDIDLMENYFTTSTIHLEGITPHKLKTYHLMFPWHLNIGFVEKYEELYKELIDKYKDMPLEELIKPETREQVLEDDKRVSEILSNEKILHFRFFEKNNYNYSLTY